MPSKRLYSCNICGFHYLDKSMAEKCQDYCSKHGVCSTEITKHSVERSKYKQ